jgi:hypothetical protein
MDRKDLMAEMDKMGKYIAIVCAKVLHLSYSFNKAKTSMRNSARRMMIWLPNSKNLTWKGQI